MVKVQLKTTDKFGLYTDKVKVSQNSNWFFSHLIPPKISKLKDPKTKKIVEVYHSGEFTMVFKGFSKFTSQIFNFSITYTGCNQNICLFPYEAKLQARASLLKGSLPKEYQAQATAALQTKVKRKIKSTQDKPKTVQHKPISFDHESFKDLQKEESFSGFLLFLGFLLLAGLVTNFTPCVYPMIPITIRILGQQSKSPLLASSVYALGIMTTYSLLGTFAALTGSLFGQIMANPVVNFILALMMSLFALSMLGYGNYNVLQNLGNRLSSNSTGLKSCYLMGLGAGLVASPCTGPVLAALLTYSATAKVEPSTTVLYLMVYSFGFSLPYVLLGRLASQITKVKLRPSLQIFVKVAFAGVMFALAFNYLKVPFYDIYNSLQERWLIAAVVGAVLFLVTFFILMGDRRFWPRVISVIFLGFALFSILQWFTAAPIQQGQLPWFKNEKKALALAQKTNKPILIDMWAEWCELCKKMNRTTFVDPSVIKKLKENKWILLKLDLTNLNEQTEYYRTKYKVQGLPALIIVPAQGKEGILLSGYVDSERMLKEINKYSK